VNLLPGITNLGNPLQTEQKLLDLSQVFSEYFACSSDICGELQRLVTLPLPESNLKSDGGGDGIEKMVWRENVICLCC
jgi:hypothetical protein